MMIVISKKGHYLESNGTEEKCGGTCSLEERRREIKREAGERRERKREREIVRSSHLFGGD